MLRRAVENRIGSLAKIVTGTPPDSRQIAFK